MNAIANPATQSYKTASGAVVPSEATGGGSTSFSWKAKLNKNRKVISIGAPQDPHDSPTDVAITNFAASSLASDSGVTNAKLYTVKWENGSADYVYTTADGHWYLRKSTSPSNPNLVTVYTNPLTGTNCFNPAGANTAVSFFANK